MYLYSYRHRYVHDLYLYLYLYLYVHTHVCLSIYIYLSIYLSTIYLYIHLSIYQSIHLPACLYPSMYRANPKVSDLVERVERHSPPETAPHRIVRFAHYDPLVKASKPVEPAAQHAEAAAPKPVEGVAGVDHVLHNTGEGRSKRALR